MEEGAGLDRRAFLRRAALTGATVAWVAPVVQTIGINPAFAAASPPFCGHSVGGVTGEGCKGAIAAACTGGNYIGGPGPDAPPPDHCDKPCGANEQICCRACPPGQGNDNPCCSAAFCDPKSFTCAGAPNGKPGQGPVCFIAAAGGCNGIITGDCFEKCKK